MTGFDHGRVIMPAMRIDREGLEKAAETARRQVESVGPAGFIIFGGRAEEVRELIADLNARAGQPLLFGADLERGAGQQFAGLTHLPTPMAIAACPEAEDLARLAGEMTAREALSVGVNLVFAPVCDVNTAPRNPIINVRGFSNDPAVVSRLVAAWIRGAQGAGVLCCAKHFPGHGAAVGDSHLELPAGVADEKELRAVHLAPFRAAVASGVSAIMTAHITAPALGEPGTPATLSPRVIGGLLRAELGFTGLVITDALIMSGIGVGEEDAAVRAAAAGSDLLLYPSDPARVKAALARAQIDLRPKRARHEEARRRIGRLAAPQIGLVHPGMIAARGATLLAGQVRRPERFLILCDNERLDPDPFRRALRANGVSEVAAATADDPALAVAVFSFPAAWRGTSGPLPATLARIPRGCGVISFGDPYFLRELAAAAYRIAAYDPMEAMQEAVAARLLDGGEWTGRLPIS